MVMKRDKANYTIQSVSHALDILESFTRTEDELGVTELSKRLALHKNNVFRLLATLENRGYIEQNKDTEHYRLGPKTLQIGSIFIEQRECRRQARPVLEDLATRSGETAVVAVLRGNKVIYMDGVETDRTVRAVSRVGAIFPAFCTAVGKIQLANLSAADVERLYPEQALNAPTERGNKTRDELQAELKLAAQRGYALENEEIEADVRGIAVPVRDFSKKVIAAIGITAPASRLTDERLEKDGIIRLIQESGRALSTKLGFIAPVARKH
jgi:IclR family transcriptional regulator, KDG regulon repressor